MELFKNKTDAEIFIVCGIEYANDSSLQELRNFVITNNYGFGDNQHYIMWREIIKILPDNFNFLEIGVYKGQILCLVPMLSKLFNKTCDFLGVTPLNNTGDKYSNYDNQNYSENITELFEKFNIPFDLQKNILCGLSTSELVKNKLKNNRFDVIFIDGGHDYDTVVSDILLSKEILNPGGFIITDDSSCYKNFGELNIFKGHIEVANAVRDYLETDVNYIEILCVGHNRVFKKNI
jgi:predicted transcriptional regulator